MRKVIIVIWIICSILSYGILFGHIQGERGFKEEYRTDMGISMLFSLAGPLMLVTSIFLSGFCEHGLKFK